MAAYPKPLSEKRIMSRAAEIGLDAEQLDFMRRFVTQCARLYGVVPAAHLWFIYGELKKKTKVPRIKKQPLLDSVEILRRMEVPFRVYHTDEFYDTERNYANEQVIVLNDLLGQNHCKLFEAYDLMDVQEDKFYAVPEDLMTAGEFYEPLKKNLLEVFVGGLRVTASEFVNRYDMTRKCSEKTGACLKDIVFLDADERFEIDPSGKKEIPAEPSAEEQAALPEKYRGNRAERLIRNAVLDTRLGLEPQNEIVSHLAYSLSETGVELNLDQMNRLFEFYFSFAATCRVMSWRGCTSEEI